MCIVCNLQIGLRCCYSEQASQLIISRSRGNHCLRHSQSNMNLQCSNLHRLPIGFHNQPCVKTPLHTLFVETVGSHALLFAQCQAMCTCKIYLIYLFSSFLSDPGCIQLEKTQHDCFYVYHDLPGEFATANRPTHFRCESPRPRDGTDCPKGGADSFPGDK